MTPLTAHAAPWNSSHRGLVGHFQDLLNEASTERSKRSEFVPLGNGSAEIGWVLFERSVMHAEVNRIRHGNGLAPVDEQEVLRVETLACGHIDYVLKYAIGCADLARGQEARHA